MGYAAQPVYPRSLSTGPPSKLDPTLTHGAITRSFTGQRTERVQRFP